MMKGTTRKVYVLMWYRDPETQPANMRAGSFFATAPTKKIALTHARKLNATVYPVPYPGTGWDCPTIRATFDPIWTPPAAGSQGSNVP